MYSEIGTASACHKCKGDRDGSFAFKMDTMNIAHVGKN